MDKGNSSKEDTTPSKVDEKDTDNDEDQATSSSQDPLSRTMQPVESKDDESAIEAIRRYMAEKLGLSEGKKGEESKKKDSPLLDLINGSDGTQVTQNTKPKLLKKT